MMANIYPSSLQVGYAFSNNFSVFTTGHMRFSTIETVNPLTGSDGQSHRSGDSKEINVGVSHFRKKDKFIYKIFRLTVTLFAKVHRVYYHNIKKEGGKSFEGLHKSHESSLAKESTK